MVEWCKKHFYDEAIVGFKFSEGELSLKDMNNLPPGKIVRTWINGTERMMCVLHDDNKKNKDYPVDKQVFEQWIDVGKTVPFED